MKKLVASLTAAFALCLLFANVISVQAYNDPHYENKVYINKTTDAKGNYINVTKFRMGLFSQKTVTLDFPENLEVTNLKTSNKGLEAAITSYYANYDSYSTWDAANKKYVDPVFKLGRAVITLNAVKAGSYKVTFNIGTSKYTLNVLATEDGIYTKATLGKTKLLTTKTTVKSGELTKTTGTMYKVTDKKGKLKFTAGKKYKITGFVVEYVDKNGKTQYKKYKNGKSITLSQKYYEENKEGNGYSYRSARKNTYIYISYKDKFTGSSVTYSISKTRGKKEVKCVSKNNITKINSVSYSPSASLTLWNY